MAPNGYPISLYLKTCLRSEDLQFGTRNIGKLVKLWRNADLFSLLLMILDETNMANRPMLHIGKTGVNIHV